MKHVMNASCNQSAPVMPSAWPATDNRPVRRRFPNSVDEPRTIGFYLQPLQGISKNPDRRTILKEFLKETYV